MGQAGQGSGPKGGFDENQAIGPRDTDGYSLYGSACPTGAGLYRRRVRGGEPRVSEDDQTGLSGLDREGCSDGYVRTIEPGDNGS